MITQSKDFVAMVSQCVPGMSSPKQNKVAPHLSSSFKQCCNQEKGLKCDYCKTQKHTLSLDYSRDQISYCVL